MAFTVSLVSEGVDLPNCTQILLARKINSQVTYHQIVGRATRVGGGANPRLLDYGGSSFPDGPSRYGRSQ